MTSRIETFFAVGLAVLVITAFALVIFIPRPDYSSEPGIFIKLTEANQGEHVFFGVNNFFDNTPLTMKFTDLNVSSQYGVFQFSNFLHDTRGFSLQFTNYTERIITFQGFDSSIMLFRDGYGVIIINLVATSVDS